MATAKKTAAAPATETNADGDEVVETPTSVLQPPDPNPPYVVEGSDGVVRIVSGRGDGWVPAQVEPTDEEIAASEAAEEAFNERLEYAKLGPEERAEADKKAAEEASSNSGSSSTSSSGDTTSSSSS